MDSNTKIVILILILVFIKFFSTNVDHFVLYSNSNSNSNSKFKIYNSVNKVYLQISDNNTLVFTPDESKASVFFIQANDNYNNLMYKGKYIKPTGMLEEPIIKNNKQFPPAYGTTLSLGPSSLKSNDYTISYSGNLILYLNPDNTYDFSSYSTINTNNKFLKINQ
jgi:hypothetical protein